MGHIFDRLQVFFKYWKAGRQVEQLHVTAVCLSLFFCLDLFWL